MKSLIKTDHLGCLIPGTILLILLLWFLKAFVGIYYGIFDFGFGIAMALVTLAYVLGYGVFLFSEAAFGTRTSRLLDHHAKNFLSEGDQRFSAELRNLIRDHIKTFLKYDSQRSEALNLCYDFLVQRRLAATADRCIHQTQIIRSMLAVMGIGFVISALILTKQVILAILFQVGMDLPVAVFLNYDGTHLIIAIIVILLFTGSFCFVRRFFDCSIESIVSTVYRSFVVSQPTAPSNGDIR